MIPHSQSVLDWDDIRSLTTLCTQTVSAREHDPDRLEHSRLALVAALREFLQVWRPGQMVPNDVRRMLLDALDAYLSTAPIHGTSDPSVLEAISEGEKIKSRLLAAIEAAEAEFRDGSSDKEFDGTLLLLLCVAAERINAFIGHWHV